MGAKESGPPPESLRQSQSFGGVPRAGHLWKSDADRVSAQLREQKKALLVAVSASVDKIVGHFSTARNLVQKTQLGDSRLSPDVGYLVLGTLCPALHALLDDGLKPFQKDVITGQRPSSAWSVVEASAKPGPHTRSLNALYWRVSRLAPLRSNQQRFHAFILGLLNMKQLELWFSHLQRNTELVSALYLPTAFLVLSRGFCHRWAEELLLLLQPLSMLTFQLDLLFEHHHLPLDVRPMSRKAVTPTDGLPISQQPTGQGVARRQAPPLAGLTEGPLAQSSPLREPQGGAALHQRLLQWGDRLAQTLLGNEAAPNAEPGALAQRQETEAKQQQSWWGQLSRASEVYTNPPASKEEGFPITHWTKLRMAVGEAMEAARSGMGDGGGSAAARPEAPPPAARPGEMGSEMLHQAMGEGAARKPERTVPGPQVCPADAQEATRDLDVRSGKWLAWLFGANSLGGLACPPAPDPAMPKSSRRPSRWLPPTMNVLALVMKAAPPVEKSWREESWEEGAPDPLQPYRAVRALCDHARAEDDQLSFRKGDILQVLDTVDEDWLQCCHGESRGLVPVSYTSLIL